MFRKAFKVAYSFGSGGGGAHHWVFLKAMQGTSVGRGLPPTLPFTLSPEDRKAFMQQLAGDFLSRKSSGDTGGSHHWLCRVHRAAMVGYTWRKPGFIICLFLPDGL